MVGQIEMIIKDDVLVINEEEAENGHATRIQEDISRIGEG